MSAPVWDASALLALINQEPGSEGLAALLPNAILSTVNLSEVAAKLVERGMGPDEAHSLLSPLSLTLHPFDEEQAYRTAALRGVTRAAGLSLGDRACLALALTLDRPVLTMDRAWKEIDVGVEVRLLRP